ncbi:hypothetical protein BG004_000319 [Podila humilis]|nr:hypothetical protein BG004_000319 [Podila humilis]
MLRNDSDDQLPLTLDTHKFTMARNRLSPNRSPASSDTRNSPRDEDMDIDIDSDHTAESSPTSLHYVRMSPSSSMSPYLSPATGSRCSSTPNLHAVNDLLGSPASSPPSSPRQRSVTASVECLSPPSLSLEPARHADDDASSIVLSPLSSPSSSPTLPSSPIPLPLTPPAGRSPRKRVNTPTPTPVSPLLPRTLKPPKNRAVNRNSMISLFDPSVSSMVLASDLARKGSMPLEIPSASSQHRLSGMFVGAPLDANDRPLNMTLAEFQLNDIYPKRQRRLFTTMHRLENRLREEGVIKKLTKEQLRGKPDKEILKPDRKSMGKKSGQGFMAQRMPALLRSKKMKKRTRPVILNNIEMAIKDKRPELALQYIALLPNSVLKRRKKERSELNNCMLLAMIYRMERVAIELVERGYPSDVNHAILERSRDENWLRQGKPRSFEYPSYFLVAVGLGMGNLVKAMIKNANLNQAWYGLTPLLLAATLNESTSNTCPPPTLPPAKLATMLSRGHNVRLDMASQTLINQLPSFFNKPMDVPSKKIPDFDLFSSPKNIVTMLLEHGADPNLGITLQQYAWANKIKTMGMMPRRRRFKAAGIPMTSADVQSSSSCSPLDNPIEHFVAAKRHESGRQWMSSSELMAKKAARMMAQREGGRGEGEGGIMPKKRFSNEMMAYWHNKSILPVELAIASGNLDAAKVILQRLGPLSLKNSCFGLLLQNDVILTLSLVKSGCPASQYDIHGCTPLHLAARRGHLEMVMVLLQLGADASGQGERRWTPLHESVSQNHPAISSLLVACGADLDIKNAAGETAEDLGRRRGLSPESLSCHLDPSNAKETNAAFLQSYANQSFTDEGSTSSTTTPSRRSTTVSRQASNDQLSATTLKSLLMLNSNSSSSDTTTRSGSAIENNNRRSQPFTGLLGEKISQSFVGASNGGGGNDSRSSSPTADLQRATTHSHQSMENLSIPSRSGSMSSISNSNSGGGDKKKKVRGFLKSIFK